MNVIMLTSDQQIEIASLKATLAAAIVTAAPYNAATAVANMALNTYLSSIAGISVGVSSSRLSQGAQLSSDGTSLVVRKSS